MKITLERPSNAPGCFLVRAEDGREQLVQTDWDFPGLAQTFGWSLSEVQNRKFFRDHRRRCSHDSTDGTISCDECGVRTETFITEAARWLRDNEGLKVEDSGYFEWDEENPTTIQAPSVTVFCPVCSGNVRFDSNIAHWFCLKCNWSSPKYKSNPQSATCPKCGRVHPRSEWGLHGRPHVNQYDRRESNPLSSFDEFYAKSLRRRALESKARCQNCRATVEECDFDSDESDTGMGCCNACLH